MKRVLILFWLSIMLLNICTYGQELRPVRGLNKKWGYVDETGKEVIPFKYEAAQEFSEGLAAVQLRNEKWGFIDETGAEIIPFKYFSVGKFSEGMVRVSDGYIDDYGNMRYSKWSFIDKNGLVVISTKYDDAGDFSESLARVKSKRKWGFINNTGTAVISFIYDDASDFSEGTACVKIKRDWGFIDKTGKEVFKNISTENLVALEQEVMEEFKKCPYCGEEILAVATKCKHCGEWLDKTAMSRKQPTANATNCAKKTAFGLDIGLGGTIETIYNTKFPPSYFASALGIRAMRHFNPYFGVDFFKINWITDVLTSTDNDWLIRLQIMPGIRGNSPVFFKCMSAYSVFRLGYGMTFVPLASHFKGLCLEVELGLNLTPTVFAGFAYNYHEYFGLDAKRALHTLSFRLGFNFGK